METKNLVVNNYKLNSKNSDFIQKKEIKIPKENYSKVVTTKTEIKLLTYLSYLK